MHHCLLILCCSHLASSVSLQDLKTISNQIRDNETAVLSQFPRILTTAFSGRLGNIMFEFASGLGIALDQNTTYIFVERLDRNIQALFTPFPHLADLFPIISLQTSHLLNFSWVHFDRGSSYETQMLLILSQKRGHILLDGCLQSWKYFENHKSLIRSLFAFSPQLRSSCMHYLHNISAGRPVVGIHIRRGDYMGEWSVNHGFLRPNQTYYDRAMMYFKERLFAPLFLVIAENVNEVRSEIFNHTDVIFHSMGTAEGDMCLASLCDHMILSVGSYSWWCGYFNRGEVVYYGKAARKSSRFDWMLTNTDFFFPWWIDLS